MTRKTVQITNFITLFFRILKNIQETKRKTKKLNSLTVNQRVLGSSPSSGAKALKKFSAFFVYIPPVFLSLGLNPKAQASTCTK